jgi:hypothetical protein
LIREGILPADQVVPGAPYQIKASDLRDHRVATALARKTGPCRGDRQAGLPIIPAT